MYVSFVWSTFLLHFSLLKSYEEQSTSMTFGRRTLGFLHVLPVVTAFLHVCLGILVSPFLPPSLCLPSFLFPCVFLSSSFPVSSFLPPSLCLPFFLLPCVFLSSSFPVSSFLPSFLPPSLCLPFFLFPCVFLSSSFPVSSFLPS